MKLLAFGVAALFAGVAGVLFAFYNQYISPSTISFSANANAVVMVVLGGLGTLWGGMIGATVLVLMQQYVSSFVERWESLLGVVFVVMILFYEGGIMGLARQISAGWRGRSGSWKLSPERSSEIE
jgi:branched-chain amino acid transport system permease protein